ncbi:MAG: hypoxanthine phosphoribosyltransferase [Nitrospinota bacterium]|nr:hypoxanthine phosphoribosyltransferase [Nitrospinota bacterium]
MASVNEMISEEQLRIRVEEISHEIADGMGGEDFTIVGVLKGSVVFLADLMRALHRRGLCPEVDFLTVSSYGESTESSGAAKVLSGLHQEVTGKTILLVDDIADTALTLQHARDHLLSLGAREAYTCVLLDKPARRRVDFTPDYHGFSIQNVFVVGYGLDAANRHRCLPYVAELKEGDGAE